jgi:hypothetical protein
MLINKIIIFLNFSCYFEPFREFGNDGVQGSPPEGRGLGRFPPTALPGDSGLHQAEGTAYQPAETQGSWTSPFYVFF